MLSPAVLMAHLHFHFIKWIILILPKGGDNNDHLKFQAVALQVVIKECLITTKNQTN